MRVRGVAASCLLVVGCSFATVRVPERVPPDRHVQCHALAPIFDGITTLGSAGLIAYGASLASGPSPGGGQGGVFLMSTGIVGAVAFGASTIYGGVKYARCTRMRDMTPDEIAERYAVEAEGQAARGDCLGAVSTARWVGQIEGRGAELLVRVMARPAIAACDAKLAGETQRAFAARAASERASAAARAAEEDRKQRQIDAQALVKQARDAAMVDDCATVVALDAKVLALDPDIHARWFEHDAVIAACLRPDGPAPVPP